MAFLSVNVNKVATLRNSRGKNTPNLIEMTKHLLSLGVKGITIHPRPDERHIKESDVYELKTLLNDYPEIEFNIEGYPSQTFLNLIKEVKPHQCTLVPDPPHVLTSNAGWDVIANEDLLKEAIESIASSGARSSLFIDPHNFNESQFAKLKELKPTRVELYTEKFADDYGTERQQQTTSDYHECAHKVAQAGIAINAGHDLNQNNLKYFLTQVPDVEEVSIGHAIFCEALYEGIDSTIKNYQSLCES